MISRKTRTIPLLVPALAVAFTAAWALVSYTAPGKVNPIPHISQALSPQSAAPLGRGFALKVTGANFVSGSVVNWNGQPLATTVTGKGSLSAEVPAANLAKAGAASITVSNPGPGGGTSGAVFFQVARAASSLALDRSSYDTGAGPAAVVAGDFTGKGVPSLAVVNSVDRTVSLLASDGRGFTLRSTIGSGDGAAAVVAGDFNNDGKLDLAVANRNDSTVTVLLGKGDGTFTPAATIATGRGPSALAVGDFNADGSLDLAVANQDDNSVSILLGRGDGTFASAATLPAVGPSSLAVGDFNGDGVLDLAVANKLDNSLSVQFGRGDGTFGSARNYAVGSAPSSVIAADFNGDGRLDLAVANQLSDSISILLGSADGSFVDKTLAFAGKSPVALAAADFSGHGKLDLAVVGNVDNTVSIFAGNGDGTFKPQSRLITGSAPNAVAVGDFSHNGKLGMAVTDEISNTVSVFGATSQPAVTFSPTSLSFGDQTQGTTSAPKTITLTNSGSAALSITSVSITGTDPSDFAQTNTCPISPSTLAAGANCTISVTFSPTHSNSRTATVSVADNATGSPQTAALSGVGTALKFVPTSLTFASQAVGTTSAAQTVTMTNTLPSAAISITGISITGSNSSDFAQTNTCGSSIGAGASCTISVTFSPTATGTRTASVSVADNSSGSPQTVPLTGTGAAATGPVASFAPTSLTFPNQTVGTSSTAETVTLSNIGVSTLTITSITVTGTNSADFTETNTCGSSVLAGKNCTISVTFKPAAAGSRSASVSVADNAPGTPQTVPLSGTGVAAGSAVTLSPTSLAFGDEVVGSTSAPLNVTVTNTGTSTVTLNSVSLTGTDPGDFAQTNTCPISPSTLAVGASCTVSVTFHPTQDNSRTATLSVADNAVGSPQTASLQGVGTPISFSPTSLTFASQTVGTTSAAQTVTMTNTLPSGSVTISGISFTGTNPGDFAQTNTCGSSLGPGAKCAISVTFTPTATGTRTATVSVNDNASGSPQTVPVSGTGQAATGPVASFSPTSLTFPNQAVGTSSTAETVTLTNSGVSTLTLTSITITGTNAADFTETNTCGTSVAAGKNCTISVTFKPAATGTRTASVSVADNAPGSPQAVPLSGTGVASGSAVTLSPTSLSFGDQLVGGTSSPLTVTVTNSGNSTVTLSSVSITGTDPADFAETNNCPISPSTLGVGASCTVSVTFHPTQDNSRTATLSVADNAVGSPQTASLQGVGTPIKLSPASLTFATQTIGTTSAAQTITMTNTLPKGSVNITSISITGTNAGDFAETNTCGSSLAPGASCAISVTFAPTAIGSRTATVTITDNASGSPQTAPLTGTGQAATGPVASFSPTSLTFTNQAVGTTSTPQVVTLTNNGVSTLTLTSITITGTNSTDFTETNTCGSSVAVGKNCTISVTFDPTATGTRSASVSVADNAPGSPQAVPLTGTGVSAGSAVTLSPTTLSFGNQVTGTTSAPLPVTVTNSGNSVVTLSSVSISGTNAGDFAQTNNCPISPSTLAVGASCTINVTFHPTQNNPRSATLSVADNAVGSPQMATLKGVGTPISFSPASLTFASQKVGTTSAPLTITMTNTLPKGTATINSITITGTNSSDFAQTNNCGSSLAPGASCTISITFTPAATGTRTATLSVSDNASGTPQTAALSGTGS